jgi:hypothetical protein
MKKLLIAALFALSLQARAGTLPPESILQITDSFTDQNGKAFQLSSRQGSPQIVAMFYTSCQYICPLIIDSAKGVEHALSDSERAHLQVLLVSLDAQRDMPPVLLAVSKERHLDIARWTLAHTDESGVPETGRRRLQPHQRHDSAGWRRTDRDAYRETWAGARSGFPGRRETDAGAALRSVRDCMKKPPSGGFISEPE